jgi:hypothetical protein
MICIVFALKYELGIWHSFEHECTDDELNEVTDALRTLAADHGRADAPSYVDCLRGIRYVFDVARGSREKPIDGDIFVFGASVDGLLVGEYEEVKRHFKAA